MGSQRLSRYSTTPVLNAAGKPRVCKETPWLIRQFEAMARYPFIDAPWLAALTGATADSITDTFKIAKREPNLYVRIAEFQLKEKPLDRKTVYQLADRGEALMRTHGVVVQHDEYSGPAQHRLMSCKARASFELGATGNVSIIPWSVINADETLSPYLATGRHYLDKKRDRKELRHRADCNPFIVHIEGAKRRRFYFPGIELDRDTEAHFAIKDKMESQVAILENGTYKKLGFPDMTFLWLTTSPLRMKNLMEQCWNEIAPAKYRRNALFKVFKDDPTGWAINEPWYYADNTPLYLNREGGEASGQ